MRRVLDLYVCRDPFGCIISVLVKSCFQEVACHASSLLGGAVGYYTLSALLVCIAIVIRMRLLRKVTAADESEIAAAGLRLDAQQGRVSRRGRQKRGRAACQGAGKSQPDEKPAVEPAGEWAMAPYLHD